MKMADSRDIDAAKETSGSDSQEPLIEEQSTDALTNSSVIVDELDHGGRGKCRVHIINLLS